MADSLSATFYFAKSKTYGFGLIATPAATPAAAPAPPQETAPPPGNRSRPQETAPASRKPLPQSAPAEPLQCR
jgi:hypothetical protein